MESQPALVLDPGEDNPLTSTPEKEYATNENIDITGISGISPHSSSNIKRLTPIEDLKSINYHTKEYINTVISKASRGETFFPESMKKYGNQNIILNDPNDEEEDELTPLFKKMINKNMDINSSTPLTGKLREENPEECNFQKGTRNIFNLSPELSAIQSDIKMPMASGTPKNVVKDAFTIFDKSSNSLTSGNSSFGPRHFRKTRKRLRTNANSVTEFSQLDNSSFQKLNGTLEEKKMNNSLKSTTQDTLTKHFEANKKIRTSNVEYFNTLMSNPQYISNLTLIIQIILNTLMVIAFIGFALVAFFAIKRDVDRKIASYVNEAIHKINACKREYLRNNCAPEMRVPYLEYKCNEWDTCMQQDPQAVVTSMAYFEVLADCMNAFFHNISMKSLLGLGCLLMFCIIIPNVLFSKFRATTINQNYYSTDHEHSTNIQHLTSADVTVSKGLHTPTASLLSNKSTSKRKNAQSAGNTSVRFNPNVSYSFYECDQELPNDAMKFNSPNLDDNTDSDPETFPGNQRILLPG